MRFVRAHRAAAQRLVGFFVSAHRKKIRQAAVRKDSSRRRLKSKRKIDPPHHWGLREAALLGGRRCRCFDRHERPSG